MGYCEDWMRWHPQCHLIWGLALTKASMNHRFLVFSVGGQGKWKPETENDLATVPNNRMENLAHIPLSLSSILCKYLRVQNHYLIALHFLFCLCTVCMLAWVHIHTHTPPSLPGFACWGEALGNSTCPCQEPANGRWQLCDDSSCVLRGQTPAERSSFTSSPKNVLRSASLLGEPVVVSLPTNHCAHAVVGLCALLKHLTQGNQKSPSPEVVYQISPGLGRRQSCPRFPGLKDRDQYLVKWKAALRIWITFLILLLPQAHPAKAGSLIYDMMGPTHWDKHSILALQELPERTVAMLRFRFWGEKYLTNGPFPWGWESSRSGLAREEEDKDKENSRLILNFPKSLFTWSEKRWFKLQILLPVTRKIPVTKYTA